MKKKCGKRICFDWDHVVRIDVFLEAFNHIFSKNMEYKDFKYSYCLEDFCEFRNDREKFIKYIVYNNLYMFGSVSEGTNKLFERIIKDDELSIATACKINNYEEWSYITYMNKLNDCRRIFPNIFKNINFMVVDNKKCLYFDYFIDVKLSNLENLSRVKILYSSYHNLRLTDRKLFEKGVFRLSCMNDIEKCIYGEYSPEEEYKIISDFFKNTIHAKCVSINRSRGNYTITYTNEGIPKLLIRMLTPETISKFLKGRIGKERINVNLTNEI